VNLRLVVVLTILLHPAFAGSRVTLSLFAISLNATPFTVGVIMSLPAILPMLFSVHAGWVIDRPHRRAPAHAGGRLVLAPRRRAPMSGNGRAPCGPPGRCVPDRVLLT
jgi:hypothetical protein